MKNFLFTTMLMLSITLISFGKTNDKNASLVKNLTTAMRSSQNKSAVAFGNFAKTSFSFNGKWVSAYFDGETNDLIGFSIPMLVTDLPSGSKESIGKRYSQYTYEEAMMFINESGSIKWFVSMARAKKPTIVLEVNTKGKVNYYGKK